MCTSEWVPECCSHARRSGPRFRICQLEPAIKQLCGSSLIRGLFYGCIMMKGHSPYQYHCKYWFLYTTNIEPETLTVIRTGSYICKLPYLKLDVPGVLDVSLEVHTIVAESSSGFTPGLLQRRGTTLVRISGMRISIHYISSDLAKTNYNNNKTYLQKLHKFSGLIGKPHTTSTTSSCCLISSQEESYINIEATETECSTCQTREWVIEHTKKSTTWALG